MRAPQVRLAVLTLAAALAVAACSGIAPLRTLKKLKDGLEARNETEVAAVMDFASVERNAKARVSERLKQANEGRVFGELRAAVADRFAERVIERIATPRGFITMACDGSLQMPPSPPPPCVLKGELKNRQSESETRYRADLGLPDGKDITLFVEKQADTQWRVVDMVMSPESFEQLRKSATE